MLQDRAGDGGGSIPPTATSLRAREGCPP